MVPGTNVPGIAAVHSGGTMGKGDGKLDREELLREHAKAFKEAVGDLTPLTDEQFARDGGRAKLLLDRLAPWYAVVDRGIGKSNITVGPFKSEEHARDWVARNSPMPGFLTGPAGWTAAYHRMWLPEVAEKFAGT